VILLPKLHAQCIFVCSKSLQVLHLKEGTDLVIYKLRISKITNILRGKCSGKEFQG
jgi:hypothetical protein